MEDTLGWAPCSCPTGHFSPSGSGSCLLPPVPCSASADLPSMSVTAQRRGVFCIHAAAGAGSAAWIGPDMLLSRGCCLLDNYFPLCCTPLQVLEGVCAEQVYLQAVNSSCNSS